MERKSNQIITVIGAGIFSAGVLLFTFASLYNRFWADDWCYNANFQRLGFLQTMLGYRDITVYAANRYSLTLFSGLLYYLRVFGVQLMTPLLILGWFFGLFVLLRKFIGQDREPRRQNHLTLLTLFLSAVIVFVSIYLAPHRYQSFYYRSGTLPYTAPMVTGLWIFILILSLAEKSKPAWYQYALLFAVVFLGGGFSEAGAAFITTLISLSFIFQLIYHPRKEWRNRHLFPIHATALAAACLAMVLLVLSPTTDYRVGLYGQPADIFTELPVYILRYSTEFIVHSLHGIFAHHLVLFGLTMMIGYGYPPGTQNAASRGWLKRTVIILILGRIAMLLLIMAVYAPSAYIEKFPPAARTRIIARFILTAYVALVGFTAGQVARRVYFHRYLYVVSVVIIFLGYLFAVRSLWVASKDVAIYRDRADIWDRRHALILEQKERGNFGIIDVPAADSSLVGGTKDLDVRETHWVNTCAARYYRVEGLRNTIP